MDNKVITVDQILSEAERVLTLDIPKGFFGLEDPKKYINYHYSVVKAHGNKGYFAPYYERLYKILKQWYIYQKQLKM